MDDWLAAEREHVRSPPISMEEGDGEITIQLSAPGFAPDSAVEEFRNGVLRLTAKVAREERGGLSRHATPGPDQGGGRGGASP
jgi:HSP20 family molecular chaperone IbpA